MAQESTRGFPRELIGGSSKANPKKALLHESQSKEGALQSSLFLID
ncbi:MAG: hypothetical protein LHW41_07185 [Candidatus Cloacimonetes bacterium]|nr:hypothetical protein [Candidatus Cloacimonadota bacterium]